MGRMENIFFFSYTCARMRAHACTHTRELNAAAYAGEAPGSLKITPFPHGACDWLLPKDISLSPSLFPAAAETNKTQQRREREATVGWLWISVTRDSTLFFTGPYTPKRLKLSNTPIHRPISHNWPHPRSHTTARCPLRKNIRKKTLFLFSSIFFTLSLFLSLSFSTIRSTNAESVFLRILLGFWFKSFFSTSIRV